MNNNEIVLKNARFFEDPARETWISRDRRMALPHEAIRDHNLEWLEARLLEDVPDQEFRFHSNRLLAPQACMEMLDRLGLSHPTPVNRPWTQGMKLRHAVALALVGWYLISPPTSPNYPEPTIDMTAPLSQLVSRTSRDISRA